MAHEIVVVRALGSSVATLDPVGFGSPSDLSALIEGFARQAGLPRDPRHAFGPGDDAERVRDDGGIAILESGLGVSGDILGIF
jgi:hypothetical protein